jgi:hypothetical protein
MRAAWLMGSGAGLALLIFALWCPTVLAPRIAEPSMGQNRNLPMAEATELVPDPSARRGEPVEAYEGFHSFGRAGIAGTPGGKEEGKAVDLRGAEGNAAKIDKIIASFGPSNSLSHEDPRLQQLRDLGQSAIDDLLDAYDKALFLTDSDKTKFSKETALKIVLEELLGPADKEIILNYFREQGEFTNLLWKYRFEEGGKIALAALEEGWSVDTATGSSRFFPGGTAYLAVALAPEEAVPLMLSNAVSAHQMTGNYLEAISRHAPRVDIVPHLRKAIASIRPDSQRHTVKTWANMALARGMPEGFEAAASLLRGPEHDYVTDSMLKAVRNFTDFRGNAEETAAWIEENRGRLVPKPRLPIGKWVSGQSGVIASPYSPDSNEFTIGWREAGEIAIDEQTGKEFILP